MRIAELLRKMADVIDHAEQDSGNDQSPLSNMGQDDPNRIKQIADFLTGINGREFANEPNEEYAGIEAVTTDAGGGVNGPKHPHDLRVKDPSQHPNQQEY